MKIHTTSSICLALGLGLVASGNVFAQTATDSFDVSITIANDCVIDVADLPFGTVTSLASDIPQATTGSITCTSVGPVSIAFDAGNAAGSTLATRLMAFGADTITYNLYRDAGFTETLGDGSSGTVTIDLTSDGTAQPLTIHGRVDGAQGPKPIGTYSSTIVATATF